MTRSELIDQLAAKMDIDKRTAEKVVVIIFDSMFETLVADGRIEIRGFGSFVNREYDGYTGRNPKTGVKTVVKPKKSPFFKVGKELKERILEF